ncbi:MAG: hypothetical protein JNL01_14535 [Bdellovibrionales bacterium]|nr:hypothetical protein [Bdellovibrionales bacterium]
MNKMQNKVMLMTGALALVLVGCESNPFPAEGYVRETAPPQRAFMPAYAVNVPPLLFVEGEETPYTLGVTVPPYAGDPIVEIDGLPAGASFDQKALIIKWKPSRVDGNPKDGSDPAIGFARYPIKIRLSATEDPVTTIEREEFITVVNSRIAPSATLSLTNPRFTQGVWNEMNVSIASVDYPQGPFVVEVSGTTGGVRIVRGTDLTQLKIGYRPTAEDFVGFTGTERPINVLIRIYQTDGMVQQISQTWTLVKNPSSAI